MKFENLIYVILAIFLLNFGYQTVRAAAIESISPQAAQDLRGQGKALIIDVREKDEIDEGMVKDALWLPLSKASADTTEWKTFLSKISKDKELVFYCRAGRRAAQVANKFKDLGYKVKNMGGFSDWQNNGLPSQKGIN